jgi:hypothetical protein
MCSQIALLPSSKGRRLQSTLLIVLLMAAEMVTALMGGE